MLQLGQLILIFDGFRLVVNVLGTISLPTHSYDLLSLGLSKLSQQEAAG